MSCQACEEFQESGKIYYYRWKFANIGITACEEHTKQIFMILNVAQSAEGTEVEKLRRNLETSKIVINAADELLRVLEVANIELRQENDELKEHVIKLQEACAGVRE